MNSTILSATVPWEPVKGIPTNARTCAMASGHEDQRAIVYVGVSGGAVTQSGPIRVEAGDGITPLGSGVFWLTTLAVQRTYLPLVCNGCGP